MGRTAARRARRSRDALARGVADGAGLRDGPDASRGEEKDGKGASGKGELHGGRYFVVEDLGEPEEKKMGC